MTNRTWNDFWLNEGFTGVSLSFFLYFLSFSLFFFSLFLSFLILSFFLYFLSFFLFFFSVFVSFLSLFLSLSFSFSNPSLPFFQCFWREKLLVVLRERRIGNSLILWEITPWFFFFFFFQHSFIIY